MKRLFRALFYNLIEGPKAISNISILLLVFVTLSDVVMRYAFSSGSIKLQELEWHLFSLIFLFGISYTFKEDAHVRVDIIYSKLGEKFQAVIDIIGILVFVLPFSYFAFKGSLSFVELSYKISEGSPDPGGLPYRFIIKACIPLSFLLLVVDSLSILRNKFKTIFFKQ